MAFSLIRDLRDSRKDEEALLLRLIAEKMVAPESGQTFTRGPGGFTLKGSTQPVSFKTTEAPGSSGVFFQRNKDTGKLEAVPQTPGLTKKEQILPDYNPPEPKELKETPAQKAAYATYNAILKWQTDYPDMPLPVELKKTAKEILPLIGQELVEEEGPEKTNWRGKPTGERHPGIFYVRPKSGPGSGGETKTRRKNPKTGKWWVYNGGKWQEE